MKLILTLSLFLLFAGCAPLVSEFSDSSGCLWTKGGYFATGGEVLVCRSGKDKAKIVYEDTDRIIIIEHE